MNPFSNGQPSAFPGRGGLFAGGSGSSSSPSSSTLALLASLSRNAADPLLISPYSLTLALALVGAGSARTTLDEMQRALGWPKGEGWQFQLAKQLAPITQAAGSVNSQELRINSACRIYSKIPTKPGYSRGLMDAFGADIQPMVSHNEINGWVNQTTEGKIKEIVTAEHVMNSLIIAVNAVYFEWRWENAFDEALTTRAPFQAPAANPFGMKTMQRPAFCHMT